MLAWNLFKVLMRFPPEKFSPLYPESTGFPRSPAATTFYNPIYLNVLLA
jgi:hypothetical protein